MTTPHSMLNVRNVIRSAKLAAILLCATIGTMPNTWAQVRTDASNGQAVPSSSDAQRRARVVDTIKLSAPFRTLEGKAPAERK